MDSSSLFYLFISFSFFAVFPTVLALIAKLKGRSWLAWGAIGFVCALVPVIGLIGWVISIIVLLAGSAGAAPGTNSAPSTNHEIPSDFPSTHRHANVAINANNGNVWLREKSGRTGIVHASEIQNVRHTWVTNSNGQAYRNRLEVTVNNLDKPVWIIEFDCHNENWVYKGRNKQEANEWSARLSSL